MFLQQQLRFKSLHYIFKSFFRKHGGRVVGLSDDIKFTLLSRLAKRTVARMLRMRRWSLIRRRAPVAQRQRQSRQQVGQCLSRDEVGVRHCRILFFFTALPQILSLHCRFCLVAACRKCVRGILPFVFRGIFEALPLLFCSLFLATKCLIAKISTT